MQRFIARLPEELENKIREYVFSDSVKIKLIVCKYNNDLCAGLTAKQLDAVYKHACLSKIASVRFGYSPYCVNKKVNDLFPVEDADERYCAYDAITEFASAFAPANGINEYWKDKNIYPSREYKSGLPEPSTEMYIDGIVNFGEVIRTFRRKHKKNGLLRNYCHNIVFQLLVCILIMKRKNLAGV